jgi:hypothetical protein
MFQKIGSVKNPVSTWTRDPNTAADFAGTRYVVISFLQPERYNRNNPAQAWRCPPTYAKHLRGNHALPAARCDVIGEHDRVVADAGQERRVHF